ncbi:hypothetical protein D9619_001929 [Psilocybe cf. subviscida]|uniref:Velvet domain-containing protein n=1 Tax=Psilocybe cf. subviscida TaxID=2480587 RepID=A0A8H5F438_9AGAR|nr:hypothetical protein D9619_001929 [Psilocybe cf. subviscida]
MSGFPGSWASRRSFEGSMELASNPHHRQTTGSVDRDAAGLGQQAPSMNDYVTFESGQFAGRRIRLELEELQKAASGRKYAKVDRRPLDPPPAVRLRLFEAQDPEGNWERELLEVLNVGLMCTVDLFPVPEELLEGTPDDHGPQEAPVQDAYNSAAAYSQSSSSTVYHTSRYPLTYYPLHPYMTVDTNSPPSGGENTSHSPPPSSPPFQMPRRQLMLNTLQWGARPADTVYQLGNHLVTESSKLTPALVGERFAEPTVIDYEGRQALVFVFGERSAPRFHLCLTNMPSSGKRAGFFPPSLLTPSTRSGPHRVSQHTVLSSADLAVRREGTFILRYRAFDIYSGVPGMRHTPLLAELYGGPFKVYSTREFPGLEPSTDLTRTLAKYGVRVTLRDAERKSKKRAKRDDE